MKRFRFLWSAIIILSLASCTSPEPATPVAQRVMPPSVAAPSAAPTLAQPIASPEPSQAATRLIPTLASLSSQTPARLVIEPAAGAPADADGGRQYDIVLYDAQRVFAIQFHLSFDATVVTFQDNDDGLPGTQIGAGEAFPRGSSFVAMNQVDQALGTLDFAATRISPAQALDGRIVVASLVLSVEGSGPTELAFGQVLLSDDAANSLPVAPEDVELRTDS